MSKIKHLQLDIETNAEQIKHTINLLRAHPEYKIALFGLLNNVNKQHIKRILDEISPNKHIIPFVMYHLLRYSNDRNPNNKIKQEFAITTD